MRHYALHRMEMAEKLSEQATPLPGFNLDQHLAQGEFQIPLGKTRIQLKLGITPPLDRYLDEAPLARDQKMESRGRNAKTLTATVQNTRELRRWILGQGDSVTVLAPRELRQEIANTLKRAQAGYQISRHLRA